MLKKLTTVVFLLVASTAYGHGNLKFVNGLWFNGTTFEPKTVYSVDNVFRATFDGEARVVDLGGRYVVPPFGDAHNHVLADGPRVDEELARYLRAGIFYVKNPNNSASRAAATRARMNTPETVDVIYANGGLTKSGGHPSQIYARLGAGFDDAWFAVDSAADLERVWTSVRAGKPDFIKIYLEHSEDAKKSRGLTPALARAIVARARRDGLRVTAHVTSTADFAAAIAAGVDEIAHLPLAPIAPADAAAAARRGVTVVTTTLSHRPAEGIADLPALHRANLALLKESGVKVVLGVDDGGPTVIDEALHVAGMGVYTTPEVLRMLVEATPRAIFPARKIGSLDEGAEASLLALDANPLEDLRALRRVVIRVKQGHMIDVAPEKRSIADALMPLLMSSGADAAVAEYHRLRREEPSVWDFSESRLNQLGYALLRHDKAKEAIAIFRLNTDVFPRSSNVWDSLGEAYRKAGRRDDAISAYRRAVELDPHNENAAKMLAEIVAD